MINKEQEKNCFLSIIVFTLAGAYTIVLIGVNSLREQLFEGTCSLLWTPLLIPMHGWKKTLISDGWKVPYADSELLYDIPLPAIETTV